MRLNVLFFSGLLLFPLSALSNDALGGRANVMECSHDEVVAYMALPDPEKRAMQDYHAWEKAFQSTEVKRSESDPSVCIGMLYGDLQQMADRLKLATQSLKTLSLPSMSEMMSQLGDKLMESICSRVQSGTNEMQNAIVRGAERIRSDAYRELDRRYGERAMDAYITDAVIPPEYQSMGLKYRNGGVDRDAFRNSVKRRWRRELNELEKSAAGG